MRITDELAFESLVKSCRRQLTSAAYYLCGDREAALDIVQETLVDAYRGFDGLRDVDKALAWLYAILRRKALVHRKSRGSEVELTVDIPAPSPDETGDLVREIVIEQMMALSEDDREILAGKYLLGLSYRELADSLKISESAVGVRCFRAMEHLREALRATGIKVPEKRK